MKNTFFWLFIVAECIMKSPPTFLTCSFSGQLQVMPWSYGYNVIHKSVVIKKVMTNVRRNWGWDMASAGSCTVRERRRKMPGWIPLWNSTDRAIPPQLYSLTSSWIIYTRNYLPGCSAVIRSCATSPIRSYDWMMIWCQQSHFHAQSKPNAEKLAENKIQIFFMDIYIFNMKQ